MRKVFTVVSALSLAGFAVMYGCSDEQTSSPGLRQPDGGGADRNVSDTGGGGDTGAADTGTTTTLKARATLTHTGLPDAGTPSGSIEIEDNGTTATVKISVTGATPGDHGVHIHANGSCDNTDAGFGQGAGGHWNPTDAGHGLPTSATHHAGDLGNVNVAAGGAGTATVNTDTIKLKSGDTLNPIGKAVIFHQGSDDGVTQPTGDAGTRAACGIIQAQ